MENIKIKERIGTKRVMSYLHIHIFIAFSFFCLVFQARRHLFSFWQYAKQNFCFIGSVVSHCVKGVQIRSFFWSIFSCIRSRKGSVFGLISRSEILGCSPKLLLSAIIALKCMSSVYLRLNNEYWNIYIN